MHFVLTDDQMRRFREWAARFEGIYSGCIGGAFTFSFTVTSIGTAVKVRHFQGAELDLSDYDEW